MKRPAFQFYPGDWQRDPALRACSVGARGMWIEMLCVMHQSEPYGHLRLNNSPIDAPTFARMIGASVREVTTWTSELERAGVFSRDVDGGIFCRRMIRDEEVREARGSGGVLGGNPLLKAGAKVVQKVRQKDNHPSNLEPTPSSSSSSSEKTKAQAPLPDWLPPVAWQGYLDMRRKGRKAPTDRAVELLLKKLGDLRAKGQDIAAVLDRSTVNGWTDVYELPARRPGQQPTEKRGVMV